MKGNNCIICMAVQWMLLAQHTHERDNSTSVVIISQLYYGSSYNIILHSIIIILKRLFVMLMNLYTEISVEIEY